MNQTFDILVVGGGIVGLTAALAMAQRNYRVAVIDAGSLTVDITRPDLRVYAINRASQELLSSLGAWQHLDLARSSPYSHMHVWDGATGASIDFDARAIAAMSLGTIIEESILKHALLKQVVAESNIHLYAVCSIKEIQNTDQGIRACSHEKSWDGRLLIIADGANSPTREQLKVGMTTWSYQQQALVATVHTEKPHQHTAYQVFNSDGPLAFLPLADPHQCSIVWSTDSARSHALMALNDEQFNAELNRAFAKELGVATLVGSRHQFPLQMRHVKQYTGERWLLLGDAAHTIHPLAGLGLNVGLADIASWLRLLDSQAQGLVSNKLLGAYQRERKHAVWQVIVLMEGLKRLFAHTTLPIKLARSFGLKAVNNLSPIKRLLIEHAAGIK